jgi:hypothetical protein
MQYCSAVSSGVFPNFFIVKILPSRPVVQHVFLVYY